MPRPPRTSAPALSDAADATADADTELTIALAEYEHVSDLRNRVDEQSAARFNFFLAMATTAAVVTVGLLSLDTGSEAAVRGSLGVLGIMVLVMGEAIFFRQVEFVDRSARYAEAQKALRTYLAKRGPGLRPYLLLPHGTDRGAMDQSHSTPSWLRNAVGLSGTVGLLNSALLSLGIGLVGGTVIGGWLPATAAAVAFLAAAWAHLGYGWFRYTSLKKELASLVGERYLPGETVLDAGRPTAPNLTTPAEQ